MKYKVGDKVKVREWEDMEKEFGLDRDGDIGIKPCFSKNMREYCGRIMTISHANRTDYHTDGNDWFWTDKMFEPVDNHKIVITTDGSETLARFYDGEKVIKTATAKCAPDDTFDFAADAKLAFERLMNNEKWRVVNRHPKVGDYIRIKHNDYSKCADIGDILKADEVEYLIVSVYNKNMTRPREDCEGDFRWNYYFFEIEVVEPINSEVKAESKTEPKYFNGKVRCIRTGYDWWTVGKVYEVKNGIITADNGHKYPKDGNPYKDAEDARHAGHGETKRSNSKNEFIPVDEEVEFVPHLIEGDRHLGNIGESTNYRDAVGRPLCVGDVVEHFNGRAESYGDTVIVKAKLSYRNNAEKAFVMGIESSCDDKKGTTRDWKIIKKRSFEEVANGEKINGIKYVKEN